MDQLLEENADLANRLRDLLRGTVASKQPELVRLAVSEAHAIAATLADRLERQVAAQVARHVADSMD